MCIRRVRLIAWLVVVSLAASDSAFAADAWVQVTSPHFTVVSNAGEKRAREVAWQFEQIRAAMVAIWPWVKGDLDRPVLVVAARDENTMKLLVPQYWEERGRGRPSSVFVTGPDRHYIALQADARGDDTDAINPYYASFWSYSALLLDASFERPLPLWLQDGLAGVLSNTIVRENEIRLGMAPPWYVRTMVSEGRLRLLQLLATDRTSTYYRNAASRELFDAQSWAFVHYLLFDPAMAKAGRLDAVIKLVFNGTSSVDALKQSFTDLEGLETAYMQHVRKELMPYSRLKTETRIDARSFSSRALTEPDAAHARAALLAAMGRPVEARALVAEARKAGEAAAGYEVEAMLADRDNNRAGVRTALAKAEQLGSTNFYALYRLAVLEFPEAPDVESAAVAERRLQKAVELNPLHAGAHATLANAIAFGPAEGRGRVAAVTQKALTLDPGDFYTRVSVARALWNAGQREVATSQARAALGLATTDQERQQAQQLIDFFAKALASPGR